MNHAMTSTVSAAGKDLPPIGEKRARRARPFRSLQQARRRWHYGDLVHRERHDTSMTDGKTSMPVKPGAPADENGRRYPRYGEKGWRAGRGVDWLTHRVGGLAAQLAFYAKAYRTSAPTLHVDGVLQAGIRDYGALRNRVLRGKKPGDVLQFSSRADILLSELSTVKTASSRTEDETTRKGIGYSEDKSKEQETPADDKPSSPPPIPPPKKRKRPLRPWENPSKHCWHERQHAGYNNSQCCKCWMDCISEFFEVGVCPGKLCNGVRWLCLQPKKVNEERE